MLSCWPSFTKVKPCSFKTCRANGNKPFFLHIWDMPQKVCRATGEHTWKHTSQLLERFMISWSQKTKQLSLFFYFLAMHPKQGTNASNRNRSCVVLISLDDMLSSSPANLCWVISWQDKVMCYNLTVCIGRTIPWNEVMWTIRLCYWAVF